MADQLDTVLIQDADGLPRKAGAVDNIQQNAEWEFLSNVIIRGALVTEGVVDLVKEEVRIKDNHLYLNDGYETVAAQTAGLVANFLPIATTDTVDGDFVAGIPATSNPTVVTAGSATFAVGQFIQIAGAEITENDGLYEVLSHVGTLLTIRGVGTTARVEDFTEDQFVDDSVVAGTITRLNVSVIRSGTDGAWETGTGSVTPVSFTDLGAGATTTLQQAYDNDPDGGDVLITTNATDGAFVIAGTEKFQITATSGLDVDTVVDFDLTSFDMEVVGGGYSLDADGASNVSVTGAALTISTITTGDLVLLAAGDVNMDGTNILLDATAGVSIDAAAASNLSATAANLTLSTITSGTLFVTSAGLLDIDAAANIDIDVTGTFDMLSTGLFSIDGTGNSNVSATSGDLTLETITTGQLLLTSVGDSVYTVPNASATAWLLTDGTDDYLRVDSSDNTLDLLRFFNLTDGFTGGVKRTTDSALVEGNIVHFVATTGNVDLADAGTGNLIDGLAMGVSQGVFSGASTAQLFTMPGGLVSVLFTAAPLAADIGKTVYLNTTAGQVTLTAPTTGQDKVVFKIGVLASGDGADTTPLVLFQPQFLSKGSQVS